MILSKNRAIFFSMGRDKGKSGAEHLFSNCSGACCSSSGGRWRGGGAPFHATEPVYAFAARTTAAGRSHFRLLLARVPPELVPSRQAARSSCTSCSLSSECGRAEERKARRSELVPSYRPCRARASAFSSSCHRGGLLALVDQPFVPSWQGARSRRPTSSSRRTRGGATTVSRPLSAPFTASRTS
ncbi:hypothetical protein T492DRAFT_187656 [Pavlovales sp. CCMP2436]|nr:hypothetical protein T492DRAFT_187656 [Pavlovales sp. CCMP2436]